MNGLEIILLNELKYTFAVIVEALALIRAAGVIVKTEETR